ncbi:PTS glucitol/sorbitol transporter subunit IIA [Streptococcus sp. CSL10205-OR2]|uniref:PTS glucitol/sorbitol transporter subunit IIA n=1 Tax=Streptococcus sp. CSL10205-OR2 TaxID=2980558 RepID=UPI0021DA2B9B|nr:PTS glucitol/sorbitol transporter subunit IIA [Streptococcus sp. CSL10205-OR2]MCU9533390.1 PTS glucitol/sorbitol transporter subunit IIA [Streptococcus sp. CSL10205-OR2]
MLTIFEANVVSVGPSAMDMIKTTNMLILFGENAPADLAEFCYIIDNKQLNGSIQSGGKLIIDNLSYTITAVGSVVEQNLKNLGHITITFDGATSASLPGTLHVEKREIPNILEGSTIQMID